MNYLTRPGLRNLCYGATFLASGGGGGYDTAKGMIEALPKRVRIPVVTVEEAAADEDHHTLVVAFGGAPSAAGDTLSPQAAVDACTELSKLVEEATGKPVGYFAPVEIGAVSTLIPAIVAAEMGLKMVDGDGAGRAVPLLTNTTYAGTGAPPCPAVVCNGDGTSLVIETPTTAEVDSLFDTVVGDPAFENVAGLALWSMSGAMLEKAVPIRGTVQLCTAVGTALRQSKGAASALKEIAKILRADGRTLLPICQGPVLHFADTVSSGHDVGQTVVRDGKTKDEVMIYWQNENLVAWNLAYHAPLIIAPDSICTMTAQGVPFSNAVEPAEILGKEVCLVAISCPEVVRTQDEILKSYRQLLETIGYPGPLVPMGALQKNLKALQKSAVSR